MRNDQVEGMRTGEWMRKGGGTRTSEWMKKGEEMKKDEEGLRMIRVKE